MSLVKIIELKDLNYFFNDNSYLSIVNRDKPKKANSFFKEFLTKPLSIQIQVNKDSILEDIRDQINKNISKNLINKSFYKTWIQDMANISKVYCHILNTDTICLSLDTSRSCKRYHIDNVPVRLLVTYHGKGTEWIPSNASDYSAYYDGKKNDKIIKDSSAIQFMKTWDIAIFKGNKFTGNEKGILHRTPDAALNSPSLLMRLDDPSFFSPEKLSN